MEPSREGSFEGPLTQREAWRAALGWLGPDPHPPEQRAVFERAARDLTARLCMTLSVLMALATVVYWPTDAWLLGEETLHRGALAAVRVSNLVTAAGVGLGIALAPALRRRAVGWTGAWTVAQVAFTAWTLAGVWSPQYPWQQAGYLAPLATCALFVPLRPRALWTVAVGVAWSGPFVMRLGSGPRVAWAASLIFETFAVVVGVAIGHVMFSLYRENWYARQEIAAHGRRVAAADEARRNLFATLSHEVRTPLTLTIAALRRLRAIDAEQSTLIAMSLRHADQMHWLIDQVLELARVEAGPSAARVAVVDVSSLVRTTLTNFGTAYADERRFELTLPRATLLVEADASALSYLLHNLLSNAVKHTSAGGLVRVRVEADAERWTLQVADDGDGIAAADQAVIFQTFGRARTGDAARRRGTGLGLALVREVARGHGGDVTVVSEPGRGAKFTVTLRRGALNARASGEVVTALDDGERLRLARAFDRPAPAARAGDDGAASLFVVEDDDVLADFLASLFPELTVARLPDGAAALERARRAPPQVIVTDLEMPAMDGWALLRALKSDAELGSIPVLVVSAQADPATRVRALEAGAADLLSKPFDERELQAKVHAAFEQRDARRKLAERDAALVREIEDLRATLDRLRRSPRAEAGARLARELHDNLGQLLTSAALLVKASSRTTDRELARARLDLVQTLLETASDALREVLADLVPERLLRAGLVNLLHGLAEQARATEGWQVEAAIDARGIDDADALLGVYRIAQQAMANALRHGRAPLRLAWTHDDAGWELCVTNALTDATERRPVEQGASGVTHMRERAAALGASFSAGAREGLWVVRAGTRAS